MLHILAQQEDHSFYFNNREYPVEQVQHQVEENRLIGTVVIPGVGAIEALYSLMRGEWMRND